MNRYRQFFTSGVGFTFVIVGITGVIFQFFFKNHFLEEIHGWLGVSMVVVAAVHIFQNWRPLKKHLQDMRVYGLLLPIFLLIAFFAFGKNDKPQGMSPKAMVRKLVHAPSGDVAKAFGTDVNAVFNSMKADGLRVETGNETVEQIARDNAKAPEAILNYFAR